jgi:hypothetical protein
MRLQLASKAELNREAHQSQQESRPARSCVRPTDAASHVGASGRSQEPRNEATTMTVARDFNLLAWLASGFVILLRIDVDKAVCQG